MTLNNSSGTNIPFDATIDGARQVITVNPWSNLSDGDVYVAVSNAHYDAHGNRGGVASATFTVDSTQPAAPAFHPSDGGTTGTAGTNITLTFGEAIKRSSAGEDFTTESQLKKILTLKAGGSGGNDLTYSVGITGGGTVITVDPAAHLADGPVYVAVSNGYFDANGNQGSAVSATFTVDTTAVGVATDAGANITVTFNEAIKRTSGGADFGSHAQLAAILTLKRTGSTGSNIGYTASSGTLHADCGLVFSSTVPSAWIVDTETLTI